MKSKISSETTRSARGRFGRRGRNPKTSTLGRRRRRRRHHHHHRRRRRRRRRRLFFSNLLREYKKKSEEKMREKCDSIFISLLPL